MRALIGVLLLGLAQGAWGETTGPLSTYLVTPCRFLDTRDQQWYWYEFPGPMNMGHQYLMQGECGVPHGARAVMLTVTATEATAAGHLSQWDFATAPSTSFLNFVPGRTVAGFVVVPLWEVPLPLGEYADFALMPGFGEPHASVHIVIDVLGYLK